MFNKITHFGLFFFALLFTFSCTTDDEVIIKPLKEVSYFDLSYGDDTEQNFDMYLPSNRDLNTPVIILVHGGSWSGGDKNDMNLFVNNVKTSMPEFAIANINYQLLTVTDNKHPTQINDIEKLILELKSKSEEYQISTDYYFLGFSAGAHLSLLFSYTKNTNNDIKAVCSIVGPTNFTDEAYINSGNTELELLATNFLGDTFQNNPSLYAEASPISHINSTSIPTILFYGGNDPLIPSSQGIDLDNKLTEFGIEHEFTFYPNEGHGWQGINAIDTSTKITVFFKSIANNN